MGATGETGKPLLRKLLEHDHTVTAIVRDVSKLTVSNPKLKKVKGNIFDFESLVPLFKGHDLVVSVLGFPKQIDNTMTKFTESMDSVLKAMRLAQVQRIVTISAWYTNPCTREGNLETGAKKNCTYVNES